MFLKGATKREVHKANKEEQENTLPTKAAKKGAASLVTAALKAGPWRLPHPFEVIWVRAMLGRVRTPGLP